MTQMERLAIELLGLPKKSRAVLAEQLLASLDEEEPEEAGAILQTAIRRGRELAEGKVEGIPAEEVFRQLDQELG